MNVTLYYEQSFPESTNSITLTVGIICFLSTLAMLLLILWKSMNITVNQKISSKEIIQLVTILILSYISLSMIFGSNKLGVRNIQVYTIFTAILYIILMFIGLFIDEDTMKLIITIICLITYWFFNTTSEYVASFDSKNNIFYVNDKCNFNILPGIYGTSDQGTLTINGKFDITANMFSDNISKDEITKGASNYLKKYGKFKDTTIQTPNFNEYLEQLKNATEDLNQLYTKEEYDNLLKKYKTSELNNIYKTPVHHYKEMILDQFSVLTIQSNKVIDKKICPWILQEDSMHEYIEKLQSKINRNDLTKDDLILLFRVLNYAILDLNAYSNVIYSTELEDQTKEMINEINDLLEKLMLVDVTIETSSMQIVTINK